MKVAIQYDDAEYVVQIKETGTLSGLKEKIYKKTGVPCEHQHLYLNNVKLEEKKKKKKKIKKTIKKKKKSNKRSHEDDDDDEDDTETEEDEDEDEEDEDDEEEEENKDKKKKTIKLLSDYGIKNECTITMRTKSRGGGGGGGICPLDFEAPDVDKRKWRRTGHNSFRYWFVGSGLNYGGKCQQSRCKAYNQPVMCVRGFGRFEPNNDQFIEEVIRCPGCKGTFVPSAFYFFRCQVVMKFKKKNEPKQEIKQKVKGDLCWELGGGDDATKASYQALIFEVTKLQN